MTPPFTLSLDIEVWADREADLEALMAELNAAESDTLDELQHEPEGAR